MKVTFTGEIIKSHYTVRTFDISTEDSTKKRTVKQFHYTSWPPTGDAPKPSLCLEFISAINKDYVPMEGPMVVHCRYML